MIKIETKSFVPIYEQIKKEIKSKISIGILKPHESLPSIRDLASDLLINPNTVARAYRELEKEGFIYTRKGKGCYVSEDSSSLVQEERENILNNILDQALAETKKFNISPEEIKRRFEERLKLATNGRREGEGK